MPFEISLDDEFCASHALRLPDGSVEPVHGHNWRVRATLRSDALDAMDTVTDFHPVMHRLRAAIDPWRNRHLNDLPPFNGAAPANPSAERVAEWIAHELSPGLPDGVRVVRVEVTEAVGCRAAWVA